MTDFFVDPTSAALAKTLDGTAARQHVLADNIANAETPNYTRKDISFESELNAALTVADPPYDEQIAAIENIHPQPHTDLLTPRRLDGNNVEIEHEMATLADNNLRFDTSAQLLAMRIRLLRMAIHEGRR